MSFIRHQKVGTLEKNSEIFFSCFQIFKRNIEISNEIETQSNTVNKNNPNKLILHSHYIERKLIDSYFRFTAIWATFGYFHWLRLLRFYWENENVDTNALCLNRTPVIFSHTTMFNQNSNINLESLIESPKRRPSVPAPSHSIIAINSSRFCPFFSALRSVMLCSEAILEGIRQFCDYVFCFAFCLIHIQGSFSLSLPPAWFARNVKVYQKKVV